MKKNSDDSHPPIEIGGNVKVPIPGVDRGRTERRNVLGVVMDRTRDGFYKIGTKTGVLKSLYARSQIGKVTQNFFNICDVPEDKEVSLRKVATSEATGSGQAFLIQGLLDAIARRNVRL